MILRKSTNFTRIEMDKKGDDHGERTIKDVLAVSNIPDIETVSAVDRRHEYEAQAIPEKFSMDEMYNYLSYRVGATMAFATTYGITRGYLRGDKNLAVYFYTFGLASAVAGSSFFGTAYLTRYVREKDDDAINYGISGCLNGLAATALVNKGQGLPRIALGGAVGAATAILYSIVGDRIYAASRKAWLESRKSQLKNGFVKTVRPKVQKQERYDPPRHVFDFNTFKLTYHPGNRPKKDNHNVDADSHEKDGNSGQKPTEEKR